jgi:nickel-dependent lactate racemase
MNTITLPQLPWHEPKLLKLNLPDDWQVEFYHMNGGDRPPLKQSDIKTAITHPIATAPLRELARGKSEVVIIFDDMTRVTRAEKIVPFLLEELSEAGIPDDKIRFVCALGCHGALNRLDFVKKLGETIVARFPVYNHNAFAHCTYVGTTKTYGTRLYLNEEVMKCDLKIAIGLAAPHPATGFGGGGKIILPGVASFETAEHNHRAALKDALAHQENPVIGMGIFDKNPMRLDCEEAARLAGLDILINCVVNMWGETVALFAGDPEAAYAEAVSEAKKHYDTRRAQGEKIVIANTFTKANEAIAVGLGAAFKTAYPQGGDVVLIANAPDGQVTHYLLGAFGNAPAGEMSFQVRVPAHINRVCIFSEYTDVAGQNYIEKSDKVFFTDNWDKVIKTLQASNDPAPKVAVYPSADIQYSVL